MWRVTSGRCTVLAGEGLPLSALDPVEASNARRQFGEA